MNGFIKIRVMANGTYFDVWQKVTDGTVVDHVNDEGISVPVPTTHEAFVLTGQMLDAPNGNLVATPNVMITAE